MPKSNQRQNKNGSQPDTREPQPIEIDETIVSGKLGTVNNVDRVTINVPLEKFLEQMSAFEIMEGEDEDEDIHLEIFEQKLEEILGSTNLEVTKTNLNKFLKYLKQNIQYPCVVTGMDEFEWEEYYTMGSGSKKEYQKLKKTKASHTDKFNILKLNDSLDAEDGILAEVERTSDKKKFTLPLAELESVVEESLNTELLEDYSMWFFSYS
ncbi:MAG: calcium-binding protein [Microcoleaceae cyanobacterium]